MLQELEGSAGKVLLIPIDDVIPNDCNINVMSAEMYSRLVESVRTKGQIQSITVIPGDGGKWVIVDGEHRWRAARECCHKTIFAMLDPSISSREDLQIACLAMNHIRGTDDLVLLGQLLCSSTKDPAEIAQKTGMDGKLLASLMNPDINGPKLGTDEVDYRIIRFKLTESEAIKVDEIFSRHREQSPKLSDSEIFLKLIS